MSRVVGNGVKVGRCTYSVPWNLWKFERLKLGLDRVVLKHALWWFEREWPRSRGDALLVSQFRSHTASCNPVSGTLRHSLALSGDPACTHTASPPSTAAANGGDALCGVAQYAFVWEPAWLFQHTSPTKDLERLQVQRLFGVCEAIQGQTRIDQKHNRSSNDQSSLAHPLESVLGKKLRRFLGQLASVGSTTPHNHDVMHHP